MSALLSLWRLLNQQQRRQLAGLQLLSIIMGLSTVGGIAAVLPFFTALADPAAVRESKALHWLFARGLLVDDGTLLIALGAAFCVIVLLANAINLFGFMAINRFAFQVGETFHVRLFEAYMQRDYEFHTRNNSSELATRVLYETARVTSGVQQGLILITNLVTICCIAGSMLLVNPLAAVGAIVGLGATYAAIYTLARGRLLRNGEIESRAHAARTLTVNESFGAIREITLLQVSDSFVQRFAQQCRMISRTAANTLAISQSPRYVLECITVISLVAIALYLHSHSAAAGPWIAQLSFVGFAAYRLLPALQQSFAAVVRIRTDRPAFVNIEKDLGRRLRAVSLPAPASGPTWRGKPRGEIRLCEVSYRYAPDRPDAVSGASLVIPAGALVGFAGPNGSGKTTLVDLICGLLAPHSGHIEVDGTRLERANYRAWQATIAYVPQQVFLFDSTLAENIACGVPAASIDYRRVEEAVRLARLTDCVAGLPGGYQEVIGERGCRLSGGQRQRLAIARALYRDASLLILDEVTSSLDSTAESEIVEALHALRSERTIVVVAHRAGALRLCDLVFELRNGKVVASTSNAPAVPIKRHATSVPLWK